MALLDPEPRLASVTAVEPTRLFRLDQAPFYELMAERPEVATGRVAAQSPIRIKPPAMPKIPERKEVPSAERTRKCSMKHPDSFGGQAVQRLPREAECSTGLRQF